MRTIAEDWKEFGVQVEIEHHSEFMARHLHLLPSAGKEKKSSYSTIPAIWAGIVTSMMSLAM